MTKMRLAVVGASGKMGRAVMRIAVESGETSVVAAISNQEIGRDAGGLAGLSSLGVNVTDQFETLAEVHADVAIDFSSPVATRTLAETARRTRTAIVSGTTGLDDAAVHALEEASRDVPVLWEPNMSIGIYVLGALLRRAIELLGPSYDIEIVETHHRMKADAPSGTALRLVEIAEQSREGESSRVYGREGRPGARKKSELGVHAVRGGDVIGDHAIHLLGAADRLELVHRASNRDLFAHGAFRAARWIKGKPAGRYTLADVLDSES